MISVQKIYYTNRGICSSTFFLVSQNNLYKVEADYLKFHNIQKIFLCTKKEQKVSEHKNYFFKYSKLKKKADKQFLLISDEDYFHLEVYLVLAQQFMK